MRSPFGGENSTKQHLNMRLPQNFDLSNMLSCTLLTKDKQTESLWGGFTCFSALMQTGNVLLANVLANIAATESMNEAVQYLGGDKQGKYSIIFSFHDSQPSLLFIFDSFKEKS